MSWNLRDGCAETCSLGVERAAIDISHEGKSALFTTEFGRQG